MLPLIPLYDLLRQPRLGDLSAAAATQELVPDHGSRGFGFHAETQRGTSDLWALWRFTRSYGLPAVVEPLLLRSSFANLSHRHLAGAVRRIAGLFLQAERFAALSSGRIERRHECTPSPGRVGYRREARLRLIMHPEVE